MLSFCMCVDDVGWSFGEGAKFYFCSAEPGNAETKANHLHQVESISGGGTIAQLFWSSHHCMSLSQNVRRW